MRELLYVVIAAVLIIGVLVGYFAGKEESDGYQR